MVCGASPVRDDTLITDPGESSRSALDCLVADPDQRGAHRHHNTDQMLS